MAEPTEEWVDVLLGKLGDTLKSVNPAASLALRALLGGEIVVREVRVPGKSRHFLEGKFVIRTQNAIRAIDPRFATDTDVNEVAEPQNEVVLEFRDPPVIEQIADKVKQLWDKGLKYTEIGKKVGRNRNLVQQALAYWHESRGLSIVDGRKTRKRLRKPCFAEPLLDQIMEDWHANLTYDTIAHRLNCDINTITKAVAIYHERLGLPVPDGRHRRKQLGDSSESKP